jgi:hypothetical protein
MAISLSISPTLLRAGLVEWSGLWESNPPWQLGRLLPRLEEARENWCQPRPQEACIVTGLEDQAEAGQLEWLTGPS